MGYQSLVMSKEERDTILRTINEAFFKKGMKYTVSAETMKSEAETFGSLYRKKVRKNETYRGGV